MLDGETVLYASSENLRATLEYDFDQERNFNYKGLNKQEIVEHIAFFISNLWQIHIFGKGNTRTTAIFLIKYLRKLGFKQVHNDLFAQHSWYFRNALVRANYENLLNGIFRTNKFLIRFLTNLLYNGTYALKNRELHIIAETETNNNDTVNEPVKSENDTVNDTVLSLIKKNNRITAKEISEQLAISLSTIRRRIKALKEDNKTLRIGSDKSGYWKIIK